MQLMSLFNSKKNKMWKHKNFINLQLYAGPQPFPIAVNGTMVLIERLSDSGGSIE